MTESNESSDASLHPLSPSTEEVNVVQSLQDVALSPPVSSRSSRRTLSPGARSPSPSALSGAQQPNEKDVDLGDPLRSPSAGNSLDISSPGPSRTPSRSPSLRSLTPSRSRSRSPAPEAQAEAGPSCSPSLSIRRTPSPSPSSASRASLRPSPLLFAKPTLPSSTPVIVTDDIAVDESAPFESIPLQTTPPPHSATLPSSPTLHPASPSRKRRSWNGFSVGNTVDRRASHDGSGEAPSGHLGPADPNSRSSISTLPPSQLQTEPSSSSDTPRENGVEEAPRLHAPPAHPHPYPLPTPGSPPPVASHEKRPSQSLPVPAALGVKGTSTFEKVISHTRPSWLPPKDRVEDETHYHQWEEMMAQARKHEEEKRKHDEARRIEREKRLAINTPKWEEMLDEKTFSAEKIRADPALRKIWFEGAPTYLRGKAWTLAIGNPLALSKDTYKSCVVRAKKAIESGRFPPDILERIEQDLDGTLVHLRLFQKGSPLREDLRELITAWVVYRSDTAMGYAPYITLVGALFLLSSPPATAFLNLVNLLSRPVMRAFYTETKDEIDAFYRVFENLQADMFPKIFANCKNLGLKVPESWFRTLLVEQVPFEAACRLWDQIVLDGDGYIFRAALAIFGFLEPRLYFPDRDEIESILEGRNQATAAILEREKERAKLRGETYQEEQDGKLGVFGLNEQALFDWLQNDGWREARFERLVTREMPD